MLNRTKRYPGKSGLMTLLLLRRIILSSMIRGKKVSTPNLSKDCSAVSSWRVRVLTTYQFISTDVRLPQGSTNGSSGVWPCGILSSFTRITLASNSFLFSDFNRDLNLGRFFLGSPHNQVLQRSESKIPEKTP